jgi:prepilin-type N-terminal cleavage/methylation domain-containing protein
VEGRAPGAQTNRGFTLIEIVVSLTIIGVVTAVALPTMLDLAVAPDAGPLESVREILVAARRSSTRDGGDVEVIVAPLSGRYQIIERHSGRDLVSRTGVVSIQDARVLGEQDRFDVVFRSAGFGVGDTLAAGGAVLRVDAATGRISVDP